MSTRVIILTKSKQAIIKEINPRAGHYKMRDGLYVLATDAIANYALKGKVKGSEIYFFEGNPNPLSSTGITDESDTFMNDFILINALEQTGQGPRINLDRLTEIMSGLGSYLKTPSNVVWLLFWGVIAYALITSLISGGVV